MIGGDEQDIAAMLVGGDEPGEKVEETESDEELAAEDVLAAFAANDPKALASALKSFFLTVDAKPHTEGGE